MENTVVTQKQNDNKYDSELASWKASHKIDGNVITSSEIIQGLQLNSSPDAKLTVNGQEITDWYTGYEGHAAYDIPNTFNSSKAINLEWSNLQNCYYTDQKGIKHAITKEAVQVSNNKNTSINSDYWADKLVVYKDPINFISYSGESINTVITFFDDQGNPIDFSEDDNAYLTVLSLNAYDTGSGTFHEAVTINSGGIPYQLADSSVTLHNGNDFYSDNDDTFTSNGAKYAIEDWDQNGSPHQYYGAGLIRLKGNSLNLTWHSVYDNDGTARAHIKDSGQVGPWCQLSTVIPVTPGPTKQSTEIHYHYDKASKQSLDHCIYLKYIKKIYFYIKNID